MNQLMHKLPTVRVFSMVRSESPEVQSVGAGQANKMTLIGRAGSSGSFVPATLAGTQTIRSLDNLFIPTSIGIPRSANQSQWIGKSIQPWWYVSPRCADAADPQHVDEQRQAKSLCARANISNCRPLLSLARPSMFSMTAFDRSVVSIPTLPTGFK
jgi:hypothetical protein